MKKSPLLAFLLSIVPGLGQLYAGAVPRGITLLLGLPLQALLFWLVGRPSLIAWLLLVWIWNLFDASRLTRGRGVSTALPLLLLIGLNVFVGWRITEIAPRELVMGLPNMQRIVTGLLQPDLLERRVEEQTATAYLTITRRDPSPGGRGELERRPGLSPPSPSIGRGAGGEGRPAAPQLTLLPSTISGAAEVRATGSGFAPEEQGRLIFGGSGRLILGRFTTDSAGRFELTADVPARLPGRYWIDAVVQRPIGGWQASKTLALSAVKMAETIFLALMGTLFSVIVTVPLSFFGAKNLMSGSPAGLAIYGAARTVMNLLRSVEVLIIALMMVTAVGIGPFAGVLALAIHGVGALGKLYSEAIESIDPGPIEAITATGASRFQVVMFGVVPQVVPQFVAFTIYRWDINVRMATVIGFVGGGGIGFILKDYIALLRWPQAGTAILLITATVIAMDYASALIRERLQ
jgi:phosphonate transport system permease protein